MQEETRTQSTPVSMAARIENTFFKDLLIPISIVMAGIIIGASLYFGGAAPVSAPNQVQIADTPNQASGDTNEVNPVTTEDHIKGSPNAPIKIVEYSDFDCPFCSRHHGVMNSIMEKYSYDDLAWVYRHNPIDQLHPQARTVALASECVAELGGNDAFWKFADEYFVIRGSGDKTAHQELILRLVKQVGIEQQVFTECLESGRYAADLKEDAKNAAETGGSGTPWSIIIGPTGKTYPINGSLPQQSIEQLIEIARQEA